MQSKSSLVIPDGRQAAAYAVALVACAFGVPVEQFFTPTRHSKSVARARQAAIYLAHVVFRVNVSSLSRSFRRDRATVRHACASIEAGRDATGLDCALRRLEWASLAFWNALPDAAHLPTQIGPDEHAG